MIFCILVDISRGRLVAFEKGCRRCSYLWLTLNTTCQRCGGVLHGTEAETYLVIVDNSNTLKEVRIQHAGF